MHDKRQPGAQRTGIMTDRDLDNMGAFVGHVLDDFRDGVITRGQAVSAIGEAIVAVDMGNRGEATLWFEQGRKLARENR